MTVLMHAVPPILRIAVTVTHTHSVNGVARHVVHSEANFEAEEWAAEEDLDSLVLRG